MRVGYSCWGFLGPGITDTPDGGRSHRRTLVDGIGSLGLEVVLLQLNRDLAEAHDDMTGYRWDQGFPDIDCLFLEWRWPIPGRNTTSCGAPGHTCDLHRQHDLLNHYTLGLRTPTIVWDKDRQLPAWDPLRAEPHVTICEPALHPTPGARSLLFPVSDDAIESFDARRQAAGQRDTPLVYVGNQYDRDEAFERYFSPAAKAIAHVVAGKWPSTSGWGHVNFLGRVPFPEVHRLHQRSLATVLLLPERYAAVGQMTQRIFEAVLAGCVPLVPSDIRSSARFGPAELQVDSGSDVLDRLKHLQAIAGSTAHEAMLERCALALDPFRLSRQLVLLNDLFSSPRPALP